MSACAKGVGRSQIGKPQWGALRHACKMGLEGIVSKRLGSRYRSDRWPDWLKSRTRRRRQSKREAEENWR
jgi:ATP-dependent DNA ligase